MIMIRSFVFIVLNSFLRVYAGDTSEGFLASTTIETSNAYVTDTETDFTSVDTITNPVTASVNSSGLHIHEATEVTVTEKDNTSATSLNIHTKSEMNTIHNNQLITGAVPSETSTISYTSKENTNPLDATTIETMTQINVSTAINTMPPIAGVTTPEMNTQQDAKQNSTYYLPTETNTDINKETPDTNAMDTTTSSDLDRNPTLAVTSLAETVTAAEQTSDTTASTEYSQEKAKTSAYTKPWTDIRTDSEEDTEVAVISVASVLTIGIIVTFAACFWKKRMKWKKKIADERQKTDIWTMHTLNNTIINDNFFDYKLAPEQTETRKYRDAGNIPSSSLRSSTSHASSIFGEFNTHETSYDKPDRSSTLFGTEKSMVYSTKADVPRPSSGYSNDSVLCPVSLEFNQSGRSRTTTFTSRKDARKANDRHTLVKHDELVFDSGVGHAGQQQTFTTEL